MSVQGHQHALLVMSKNQSPRYKKLDMLERYVEGTQYEGLPSFYDQKVPLQDRAPSIVYPIVKNAIDSNIDLILGEGKFPQITTAPGEDDSKLEDFAGLDPDESEYMDRFIIEVYRLSKFKNVAQDALRRAQEAGSVASVVGLRDGKPFVENLRGKWCTPELDTSTGKVVRLTVEYPFIEQVRQADGTWEAKCYLYRRVIDKVADTVFVPTLARSDGLPPTTWRVQTTVKHGMGFCPVVWYAFMKETSPIGEFDGKAIHCDILDEITAHDRTLSQRDRAALYAGDPQPYEIGVEPGYNPTGQSLPPQAIVLGSPEGGIPNKDNLPSQFRSPASGGTRKKGPGIAWQYANPDTKVGLMVLPGDALKAIDEHAKDLRAKLSESLSVVFLDPDTVKFAAALSAKALEVLRERHYARCSQIRGDFWDSWMYPTTQMLMQMSISPGARVRGSRKAKQLIDKSEGEPLIFPRWGQYIAPAPQDEAQTMTAVVTTYKAGLVSKRQSIEKLRRIFPVESIDQALDSLSRGMDPQVAAADYTAVHLAGVESETLEKQVRKNLALSLVPGADEATVAAIERETAVPPPEPSSMDLEMMGDAESAAEGTGRGGKPNPPGSAIRGGRGNTKNLGEPGQAQ